MGFGQALSSSKSDHVLISLQLSTRLRSKARAKLSFVLKRHFQSSSRFGLTSASFQDRIRISLGPCFFFNFLSLHAILSCEFHTVYASTTLPFRHSSICVLLDQISIFKAPLSDSQGRLWLYCP